MNKRPRAERKAERPQEILAAALELFLTHGFAATRMEQVAARAGLSKGALYLYYPSKEALLTAALEAFLLPRLTPLRALLAQRERPAWTRLRELFQNLQQMVSAEGPLPLAGMPKLMIAECGNFPQLAARFVEAWILPIQQEVLQGLIEQGCEDGEFSVEDPCYQTRVIVAGMVFQLVWLHSLAAFDPREQDMPRYFAAWMEQVRRGLGHREAGQRAAANGGREATT